MIRVVSHPLIQTKLALMRDAKATTEAFRKSLQDITLLMFFEVFRHYPTRSIKVKTPLASVANAHALLVEPIFVPVLRAGLGMSSAAEQFFANAKVGHIGMRRANDGLSVENYLFSMPNAPLDTPLYVLEPMIATGSSALWALQALYKAGYSNITLVGLIAAPEGLKTLEATFPKLAIYVAAIDLKLNEQKYIEPGLGDAGDRLFGTL